jgi:branched-subunit amino acid transport protein
MKSNIYLHIAIMALVTYAIRVIPLAFIRREIRNHFIRSFLYYVPYVTLAVMTFPAIVQDTQTPISGALALVIGIATAWRGLSLFHVACCCCAIVFLTEIVLVP